MPIKKYCVKLMEILCISRLQ